MLRSVGLNWGGTKLVRAKCNKASMSFASLVGCDLREADLSAVSFFGADLSKADLTSAVTKEASFKNAKLDGIKGHKA